MESFETYLDVSNVNVFNIIASNIIKIELCGQDEPRSRVTTPLIDDSPIGLPDEPSTSASASQSVDAAVSSLRSDATATSPPSGVETSDRVELIGTAVTKIFFIRKRNWYT